MDLTLVDVEMGFLVGEEEEEAEEEAGAGLTDIFVVVVVETGDEVKGFFSTDALFCGVGCGFNGN